MDVSDLRKRILRALDDARKDATARRAVVDQATQAYADFLETRAVPVLKQALQVLRGEGKPFTLNTPADGPRLVSDASTNTFLEFALDTMKRAGMVVAMVETGFDPGHAPARGAYEKAGFVNIPAARYWKQL